MKKIFIALMLLCSLSASAQISIGLRENKFGFISYEKNNWLVKLEHSIYNEPFADQYVRGYAGYKYDVNEQFHLSGNLYGGTVYKNYYQDFGANLEASYDLCNFLSARVDYNPNYDTFYKWEHRYLFELKGNVTDEVAITADYSTIPENRISEKRAHVGVIFHVKNLWVKPALSIPIDESIHTLKVVTSVQYTF